MKLKSTIIVLLTVVITFYIIGFIGIPFLFVVFLIIAELCLLATAFLLLTNLIWKLLSPDMRKTYDRHKLQYRALVLVCFMFLFLGGWVANHYLLPDISHTETHSTETLKSLPYLTWTSAEKTIQESGVVKYDKKQSFKGINIYNSLDLSTAYLIDMSGNVLHTWSVKINEDDSWHHIKMYENGDLLAIIEDAMLIKLDWDSNIKWIKKMRFHHDIAIAENKDIYVIRRKDELVFISGLPVPILDDYIVVLSPDGEIKKEISLFKVLKEDIPLSRVSEIYRWIVNPQYLWEAIKLKVKHNFLFHSEIPENPIDIFHNNTIEVIDRNISGLCKKGDLLISVRDLDLIGVLDVRKEELTWGWGPGNLNRQHHPTLLENGNILIFDNGYGRGYSRVVELDPLTKKIVWEYKANPPDQFYSLARGSSQRLPNGNTLITESNKGHVFEITRDGNIVWEFYNPEIKIEEGERAIIYRMMRIIEPENLPFFRRLK